MRIILESHPGLVLVDPTVEILRTIDDDVNDTFTPQLLFIHGESRIFHEMPPQPYVDGSWTNDDRDEAVSAYVSGLATP